MADPSRKSEYLPRGFSGPSARHWQGIDVLNQGSRGGDLMNRRRQHRGRLRLVLPLLLLALGSSIVLASGRSGRDVPMPQGFLGDGGSTGKPTSDAPPRFATLEDT